MSGWGTVTLQRTGSLAGRPISLPSEIPARFDLLSHALTFRSCVLGGVDKAENGCRTSPKGGELVCEECSSKFEPTNRESTHVRVTLRAYHTRDCVCFVQY